MDNSTIYDSSTILLKLTGNIFADQKTNELTNKWATSVAQQIKKLDNYQFGIVIGGGNFFRGNQQGVKLNLIPDIAHQIGMLATMMNGLMLQDIFYQQNIYTTILSALDCPSVGNPITTATIIDAFNEHQVIIFVGGTGTPFVTTDTAAVIRALQIGSKEIWKATSVDGIYTADPKKTRGASRIKKLSYEQAIANSLEFMDPTALLMAHSYQINTRVFNIFEKDALLKTQRDKNFGSLISYHTEINND